MLATNKESTNSNSENNSENGSEYSSEYENISGYNSEYNSEDEDKKYLRPSDELFSLGAQYEYGTIDKNNIPNINKAELYYTKSANLGHEAAAYRLGLLLKTKAQQAYEELPLQKNSNSSIGEQLYTKELNKLTELKKPLLFSEIESETSMLPNIKNITGCNRTCCCSIQ